LKLARLDDDPKDNFTKVALEQTVVDAYQKVEKLAQKKSIVFDNNLTNISIQGDKQSLTE
jgi:hypothetical protein